LLRGVARLAVLWHAVAVTIWFTATLPVTTLCTSAGLADVGATKTMMKLTYVAELATRPGATLLASLPMLVSLTLCALTIASCHSRVGNCIILGLTKVFCLVGLTGRLDPCVKGPQVITRTTLQNLVQSFNVGVLRGRCSQVVDVQFLNRRADLVRVLERLRSLSNKLTVETGKNRVIEHTSTILSDRVVQAVIVNQLCNRRHMPAFGLSNIGENRRAPSLAKGQVDIASKFLFLAKILNTQGVCFTELAIHRHVAGLDRVSLLYTATTCTHASPVATISLHVAQCICLRTNIIDRH
jgi:hypothetical protein